jgi:cytochrome c peroxidase
VRSVVLRALALAIALTGCRRATVEERQAPARATPPPTSTAPPTSAAAKSFYAQRFSRRPMPAEMTELGRQLFFDVRLSASGRMSCASCHDPRFAYGPPNDRATQLGGPDMKSAGLRAAPSLRYLQGLPAFSEHYYDEAIEDSKDQGPTGGYMWDGRAASAHEQARLPLTSPFEMANPDVASVVARFADSPLAARFRGVFGSDVFDDQTRATTALLLCLEVFQQSPQDFYPYTSRYDDYLRGKETLSSAEQRGLALFKDPKKGNCDSCHPSGIRHGAFPQFTDYGYAALGVPRNRTLPASADPSFHDLGLCGPVRTDLAKHLEYCGQFRAPSLRNVSVRRVFFHNGVYRRLAQVIAFYAQRDTDPGRFYKGGAFDDLPAPFQKNVNREPPFGGKPGGKPALSSAEIDDLTAFLRTLTDADLAKR